LSAADVQRTATLSVREAAKTLRTSPGTIIKSRRTLLKTAAARADFRLANPAENQSADGSAGGC